MTELMIPIDAIAPETVDFDVEMTVMAKLAQKFLKSFTWCKCILSGYLAWGFPKLGVFLFNVDAEEGSIWIWVISGEVPPAYIDFELCPNAFEALEGYVGEFKEWVKYASEGKSVNGLMPVYDKKSFHRLTPTPSLAADLDDRLEFIRRSILTEYRQDLTENRYRKD